MKWPYLFFSVLCLAAAGWIFFSLPTRINRALSDQTQAQPCYLSPVYASGNLLKIRHDVYGKGYFGASRSRGRTHQGIDILAPVGRPILASKSGRVSVAETEKGYGQWVEILHADGLRSRYAHLSRTFVNVGDWVRADDIIGTCGKTGNAKDRRIKAHLHFEIRSPKEALNPAKGLFSPLIRILDR